LKRNQKLNLCIILLAGLIFPAGCSFPLNRIESIPSPALTAARDIEETYPASPEEVVLLFLEAYPSNPPDGIKYLSPRLTATLTEDSALRLLPLREFPSGYNLQQGSTSIETQVSVILVEIIYDAAAYWVEFGLSLINGRWMIDTINSV
jgi:hypothetical protein